MFRKVVVLMPDWLRPSFIEIPSFILDPFAATALGTRNIVAAINAQTLAEVTLIVQWVVPEEKMIDGSARVEKFEKEG